MVINCQIIIAMVDNFTDFTIIIIIMRTSCQIIVIEGLVIYIMGLVLYSIIGSENLIIIQILSVIFSHFLHYY